MADMFTACRNCGYGQSSLKCSSYCNTSGINTCLFYV